MLNTDQDGAKEGDVPSPESAPETRSGEASPAPPPAYEESLVEELGAVIDDAKNYAAAELAFQKTRGKLLGKSVGIALGAVVLAIILLHLALIAMAVGFVIALEPLVTIWGAIAIVVGVMLLGVAALGYLAYSNGRLIAEMFASDAAAEQAKPSAEDAAT